MMRSVLSIAAIVAASSTYAGSAFALDPITAVGYRLGIIAPDLSSPPPRRYLTTYMAKYPFGVLREDYTPLGAPGVSKRDYFGSPMLTATLHVPPRRYTRGYRRAIVSARY